MTKDEILKVLERARDEARNRYRAEIMGFFGSYARGNESAGSDLDVLVVSGDVASVMDHFAQYAPLKEVLARGDTKMSVRLDQDMQVDLRVVPAESFGAALQYFTGSKDHNVVLRT